jgi:hypothetical protein
VRTKWLEVAQGRDQGRAYVLTVFTSINRHRFVEHILAVGYSSLI